MKTLIIFLLLIIPAFATNRTVKAVGGGDCTVIQTCVNLMAAGDTTTVFVGTYNENVTISAGSVGSYKTLTVNGSDVVSVTSVTLGSHTKLIGNCTPGAAIASCGFSFNRAASPGSACLSLSSSATDIFIRGNVLQSCARLTTQTAGGNTFYYIQGNTFAWAQCAPPTPGQVCGQHIGDWGDNSLVENNDFSHYQLAANIQGTKHLWRNNNFHDQFETEAGSNHHTDSIFMEPNFTTQQIVLEGNLLRNAVGPNAKQHLTQDDSCSPGPCTFGNVIQRFNVVSRTGGAAITDDKTWPNVKVYNNTFVDEFKDLSIQFGGDNMLGTGAGNVVLNSIWYYTFSATDFNPYACTNCSSYGHSLYFCTGTCTNVHPHTYGSGTFTSDPGNLNADPKFANYVSAGSAANDYHLQSGSPAIAAGTSLTTVANTDTGSGTSLIVNDVTYFQDGYGLANPFSTVAGDCISVTTVGNHACITAINYSTNTLTLSGSISRSSGDPVWLYSKSDGVLVLTGSAPDMGAFPFGPAVTPTTTLAGGTYVGAQSAPLNTASVGAFICYNFGTSPATPAINGGTTCGPGSLVPGAVLIAVSGTLKAVAGGPGFTDSGVLTVAYTIDNTPQYPQIWVDNRELDCFWYLPDGPCTAGSPALTTPYVAPTNEYLLGNNVPPYWTVGTTPAFCTFSFPYPATGDGLENFVTAMEACRTAEAAHSVAQGIIVDVPVATYLRTAATLCNGCGLEIPQTSTTLSTAPLGHPVSLVCCSFNPE